MQDITFIINMGLNNLEYVKLLLTSLKTNLDGKTHEILIFVDADNENSIEYLTSIKKDFYDLSIIQNTLDIPVGYQRNKTILTKYAKHEIISYLQSDMVVGPHYDTEILTHVKEGRILSATRIEPPLHGMSPVTITQNLGLHPSEFNINTWNSFSDSVKREELTNYFFAPFTFYKKDWLALDGYDTVFRRAREDSDLVQRCLHAGIELVQTFSANVYHFTCVTSRGNNWFKQDDASAQKRVQLQKLADSIEVRRFLRKWGNFNHGESKLYKLDLDLVVKNYNLSMVEQIEPFFSRVWLQNETDRETLIKKYNSYHSIANELLQSTDTVWDSAKHLYRVENFEEIFRVGEPTEYATKIEIDFSKVVIPNSFFNNIQNLYHLLVDCEAGTYELDNIIMIVNNIKRIEPKIVADNPPFDYNVLKVI